jgi:hypothetical protein
MSSAPTPAGARLRTFVLRGVFVLLGGLAAVQAARGRPVSGAERAWSVQLHLHGSFSEGEGSLDSHGYEARDVGCDVLWWSDHDFRITTFEHVTRYGFEAWHEPLDRGEAWTTRLAKYAGDKKGLGIVELPEGGAARLVEVPVREGERSLRLVAPAARGELRLAFGAERSLHRRSLATGVRLDLALFPEQLPEDAHVFVEVRLSEHAPRAGLGLEPRFLRYEIGTRARAPERRGPVWVVPVRCEPGRWNALELELSADAVRGFPEDPGEDNALVELELGLAPGSDAPARVTLDDLRIQQARSGPALYARQAELIAEVGAAYPGLTQLQGLEVSYDSRHLNLFCEETPLPDYAALARDCPRDPAQPELLDQKAFRQRVQEWVLAEVRARGGLVSYNHPFGVTFEGAGAPRTRAEQLAILLANRADGADLLEVGYRARGGVTLDDHLWLWDQAALAGLRLVGTGVSDSHGGPENRWRGTPNNFVSWIWAPAPDARSLIAGLRAGRVFFGDLERFDGTLDLLADSGERMGATIRTERAAVGVTVLASGTRRGQSLVVVESGVRTQTFPVRGESVREELRLALPATGPALVRVELHDETGPIALSNPLHFLVVPVASPDSPTDCIR